MSVIDPDKVRVDDDVPMQRPEPLTRRSKRRDPVIVEMIEKFKLMAPGQSFFVEGANKRDVDKLRKPFLQAGLGYVSREVECDEIYQTAGVRVWRLFGEYDEL